MGKGLIAAARTTEVKYALRAFLHEYQAPEIALAHLNNFICKKHRLDDDCTETFIVLALAVVDTAKGLVTLSSAGAEGFAALAEKAGPTASLRTLKETICAGARAFAGGVMHDDACLPLARRCG